MKNRLLVALLVLLTSACIEKESDLFAPPKFDSVDCEVLTRSSVLLRCTLSEGRADICGFMYGEGDQMDKRVECELSGDSFEAVIKDIAQDREYSWCAFTSAGGAEIQSTVGTFNIPIDFGYPPVDEVWYTAVSGGAMDSVFSSPCANVALVINTFYDGHGALRFNGPVTNFKEGVFWFNDQIVTLTLPSSLVATSYSCFREMPNLVKIDFAPGFKVLEDSSVHHNEQLKEVILPDTVVAINKDALSHCYALEHIDLPPNLEYLGVSAFLFCTSLKEIVLPASLKWIGIDAFRYDEALTSITCLAPTPPSGEDGMFHDTAECPIYVPAESVDAYRTAPYWSEYEHRIRAIGD